jgi:recombination protein RecA
MAKKTTNQTDNPIPTSQAQKLEMANSIVSQLTKTFGSGSIMKMGQNINMNVEVVSTGSIAVDLAIGGGFPKGRIIEIYGPEASGKTSLALSTIAQVQQSGGIAAFIDAEHALDPSWATKFGVNIDDLYVSQPGNGEEALEIVDNLVRSNAFDVIVIDSVAALVPKSEIEGNMGDSQMGVQARLMSQALRKLTGAISKSNTIVIFINQIRLKIGVMFGSPETTTGGQALKFYASIRLDVRKIGMLKSGTEDIGMKIKVKVVKNKMAPPFKIVEVDMIFAKKGIFYLAGEIVDIGSSYDIIVKTGNTYTLTLPKKDPIKLGVGRDNAANELNSPENEELKMIAKKAILESFRQKQKNPQAYIENDKDDEDEEDEVEIEDLE